MKKREIRAKSGKNRIIRGITLKNNLQFEGVTISSSKTSSDGSIYVYSNEVDIIITNKFISVNVKVINFIFKIYNLDTDEQIEISVKNKKMYQRGGIVKLPKIDSEDRIVVKYSVVSNRYGHLIYKVPNDAGTIRETATMYIIRAKKNFTFRYNGEKVRVIVIKE